MTGALLGAALAAAVASFAYRARALTAGGAVAAFVVGALIFGATGWRGALVLFAFFIPSTLLSRLGRARKRLLDDSGKHGPRDAWQVLANGGVAVVCALLASRGGAAVAAGFSGAFAAAAADTWGTEIGTLSSSAPRSLLTFRPVPAGLSGGITLAGTLATFAGAAFVAGASTFAAVSAFWPVAVGGIAGAFLDSLIGATLQAQRWCPQCMRACETNPHRCGSPAAVSRGLGWLENDAVNLAATLAGAVVAGSIAAFASLP